MHGECLRRGCVEQRACADGRNCAADLPVLEKVLDAADLVVKHPKVCCCFTKSGLEIRLACPRIQNTAAAACDT